MRPSFLTSTLCFALTTRTIARPTPEPWDLGQLWKDVKETASNIISGLTSSIVKPGCDANRLNDINYFAEYAAAAYCAPNHVVGTEVRCPDNICPTVTQRRVHTIMTFNEGKTDTTGIIARDDDAKYIVVTFRGSRSFKNWITNIALILIPAPAFCKDCKIHKGFYEAYQEVQPRIQAAVEKLVKQYPGYRIVTTGHSLGGALATIAAVDLRKRWKVESYTYGSPRIGNAALSFFITSSTSGSNYRITHLDDPVPRLPLLVQGYTHVSPEYHIFRGDHNIRPQDVNIVEGLVNFKGNTAADGIVSLNISAHLRYLGRPGTLMTGCAKGLFEL
ncbi:alpha/beta-hydrolase [Ascodesmis nigricans]|uniref:Alpha/beta-hydrolase n=1 Tax=Ascodesmis nigricans TaxID=341454 RepID=A0A4V3SJI7_9PEZI|nr:alpha/beta-hydrolase [Ascodesmis nigricans]